MVISENCPTICLNMIVKNESKIITRLLESVLSIIDSYCICDTGSIDDTIKIITDFFNQHNIPGKIIHESFRNFAYNRNYALEKCQGMSDYILLLDADMILETINFNKYVLWESDYYTILQGNDNFYYQNTRIIKNNGLCKYIGVTHEYISVPKALKSLDKTIFIRDVGDGGAKSDKFERDILLLTDGIEKEPENRDRYLFYLGNSYYDNGQYEKAIEIYLQKITLNGWNQEVWYSYYRIGLAYKNLNDTNKAIYYWLEGFEYFPNRVENLYEIVKHYRTISKHKLANVYYQIALKIMDDKSILKDKHLFLRNDVYTYKLYYEYSIFAFYLGFRNINNECIAVLNHSKEANINRRLITNMKFYKYKLQAYKTLCYSDTFETQKLVSSSSSLIPNPNPEEGYLMNVRYVNYHINPNGSYSNCEKIITQNRWVKLDNSLKIVSSEMFDLSLEERKYIGIEDIKIFYDNATKSTFFIGTGFHKNNQIGISVGNYGNNVLVPKELKCSFHHSTCEKNWVYVDFNNSTHIIYKWFPLQICAIHDTEIQLVVSKQMPLIFSHMRGSTCGFKYLNENIYETWFIVHMVSYENPRHYYHMIAVFDANLNLSRYSAPFVFEGEPIEYCLSILVEPERVLINYSTWDRSTKIGVYDKVYIDSSLKYF